MGIFRVTMTEQYTSKFYVKAEDEEEAVSIARRMYEKGDLKPQDVTLDKAEFYISKFVPEHEAVNYNYSDDEEDEEEE